MEYEGGRSEEDLVNFLNEKCVTERAVGGGLNEKVCVQLSRWLVSLSLQRAWCRPAVTHTSTP